VATKVVDGISVDVKKSELLATQKRQTDGACRSKKKYETSDFQREVMRP
jgi:hypothetical protein